MPLGREDGQDILPGQFVLAPGIVRNVAPDRDPHLSRNEEQPRAGRHGNALGIVREGTRRIGRVDGFQHGVLLLRDPRPLA